MVKHHEALQVLCDRRNDFEAVDDTLAGSASCLLSQTNNPDKERAKVR